MFRSLAKTLTTICLLSATSFAIPAGIPLARADQAAPTSVRASYKVYKAGIWIGTVEEQFSREGDHYKIVSTTDTAGPLRIFLRDRLTVTSEGTVSRAGLKPNSYEFTRRDNQKKNISAAYDWDKQQIHSHHSGEDEVFDLPMGTQDRASAMYQFMFNIPRSTEVSLWMSQGKKAEQYRYLKIDEPVLTINNELFATVYYARDARQGESKAHLWLAKDRYYLPVKIVFEDAHGASLEQLLVALHTE